MGCIERVHEFANGANVPAAAEIRPQMVVRIDDGAERPLDVALPGDQLGSGDIVSQRKRFLVLHRPSPLAELRCLTLTELRF